HHGRALRDCEEARDWLPGYGLDGQERGDWRGGASGRRWRRRRWEEYRWNGHGCRSWLLLLLEFTTGSFLGEDIVNRHRLGANIENRHFSQPRHFLHI